MKIEFEFGDHYKNLENEQGANQGLSLPNVTNVTNKQQAQEDIDKSRITVSFLSPFLFRVYFFSMYLMRKYRESYRRDVFGGLFLHSLITKKPFSGFFLI